ncbi:hypothetical protein NPIL_20711, partial [Nephila pilipes]
MNFGFELRAQIFRKSLIRSAVEEEDCVRVSGSMLQKGPDKLRCRKNKVVLPAQCYRKGL